MVIDYKDVSFSFAEKRRRKILNRIKLILLALFIIAAFFSWKSCRQYGKVKNLQELLLQNRVEEAAVLADEIEGSLFYPDTRKELKALVFLFRGEPARARQALQELAGEKTAVVNKDFLDFFSDKGRYRELKVYTDYLLEKGEPVLFYKVLYTTAFLDAAGSARVMEQLSPAQKAADERELEIIANTNKALASGRIDYIFDINGKPLAAFDMEKKETVSLCPGLDFSAFNEVLKSSLSENISPGTGGENNKSFGSPEPFFKRVLAAGGKVSIPCSGIHYYKLTINRDIQENLHRLFRYYHGSFLMVDLSDGSIAAAYSKPLNKKKPPENTVFFEEYEPASIIKVLTLFAYLKHDGSDIFPLDCKGNIPLSGKIFYDWIPHGRVTSYDEALAESCNIAFARMGLKTGVEKLTGVLEKFYFNSEPFRDLFLDFKTGIFKPDRASDFQLAKLAVGLSNNNEKRRRREKLVTTTTFHSALTAAFIAHDGAVYAPHLIENVKNLLNIGFYTRQKELLEIFKENMIFLKVKNAMKAVVTSPRGTGRRSRVDFVETAVKTGTGGDRAVGYDAVLCGFFPAGKPRYAFAFRLQRAGKAERKGALFLKDFLISFYNR